MNCLSKISRMKSGWDGSQSKSPQIFPNCLNRFNHFYLNSNNLVPAPHQGQWNACRWTFNNIFLPVGKTVSLHSWTVKWNHSSWEFATKNEILVTGCLWCHFSWHCYVVISMTSWPLKHLPSHACCARRQWSVFVKFQSESNQLMRRKRSKCSCISITTFWQIFYSAPGL